MYVELKYTHTLAHRTL